MDRFSGDQRIYLSRISRNHVHSAQIEFDEVVDAIETKTNVTSGVMKLAERRKSKSLTSSKLSRRQTYGRTAL